MDHSPPNSKSKKRSKSGPVAAIKKGITSKEGWEDKIRDQRILLKWLEEALAQGVPCLVVTDVQGLQKNKQQQRSQS